MLWGCRIKHHLILGKLKEKPQKWQIIHNSEYNLCLSFYHQEYVGLCLPTCPGNELQCIPLQGCPAKLQGWSPWQRIRSPLGNQGLVEKEEMVAAKTLTDVHTIPSPHPQHTQLLPVLSPCYFFPRTSHPLTFTHLFVSPFQNINSIRLEALSVHSPLNWKSWLYSRHSIIFAELINESLVASHLNQNYQIDHIFISLVKDTNLLTLSDL